MTDETFDLLIVALFVIGYWFEKWYQARFNPDVEEYETEDIPDSIPMQMLKSLQSHESLLLQNIEELKETRRLDIEIDHDVLAALETDLNRTRTTLHLFTNLL